MYGDGSSTGMRPQPLFKLQEYVAHQEGICCAAFGKRTGGVIATGGRDCRVKLWTFTKTEPLMDLIGHTSSVECVKFNLGEDILAAASIEGVYKLWDLQRGQGPSPQGFRQNLEFHPFGEYLASSCGTQLKLWDIRRKECIKTYAGPTTPISVCRFSPDGKWAISGDEDGVVKVWDLTAGKLLHELVSDSPSPVTSMGFHPYELLLATGAADGAVRLWDLDHPDQCVASLCRPSGPSSADSRFAVSAVRTVMFRPTPTFSLLATHTDCVQALDWQPPSCYHVDASWSPNVADTNIVDDKYFSCSIAGESIQLWLAPLAHLAPSNSSPARGTAAKISKTFHGNAMKSTTATNKENVAPRSAAPAKPATPSPQAAAFVTAITQPQKSISQQPQQTPALQAQSPAVPTAVASVATQAPPAKAATPPPASSYKNEEPQQPAAPVCEIVPAQRERPVPLNVDDFLVGNAEPEEAIAVAVGSSHDSMMAVLNDRLSGISTVRILWTQGDYRGAIVALTRLGDVGRGLGVAVDVLPFLMQEELLAELPDDVLIDIYVLLLPVLVGVLLTSYEDNIGPCVQVLKVLLPSYEKLAPPPNANSQQRMEFAKKQEQCVQNFVTIKNRLNALSKTFADCTADSYYYVPPLIREVLTLGEAVWRR